MQPRTAVLLEDILDSIGYIVEDTAGMTYEAFVENRQVRQLVAHNLQLIGEAISRLRREDPATVEHISGYNRAVDMRNALIHGYDLIDYATVWTTIHKSLPQLAREVTALLSPDAG